MSLAERKQPEEATSSHQGSDEAHLDRSVEGRHSGIFESRSVRSRVPTLLGGVHAPPSNDTERSDSEPVHAGALDARRAAFPAPAPAAPFPLVRARPTNAQLLSDSHATSGAPTGSSPHTYEPLSNHRTAEQGRSVVDSHEWLDLPPLPTRDTIDTFEDLWLVDPSISAEWRRRRPRRTAVRALGVLLVLAIATLLAPIMAYGPARSGLSSWATLGLDPTSPSPASIRTDGTAPAVAPWLLLR